MDNLPVTVISKRRKSGKSFFRLVLAAGIAVAAVLFCAKAELYASTVDRPFRMAMTYNIFQESNKNDVRIALKLWIKTLAEEQGCLMESDPNLYETVEDLMEFARANPVDAFGVTTPEYVTLSREMSFDLFAAGTRKGQIERAYLLLVRKESNLERLDQLAACSLNVLDQPAMSLAVFWLDTVLLEGKLQRTSRFFKRVTMDRKVSQVVLPVFFGKVDACLVTKESFEVMSALNPQIEKQLRILSSSPPVVPAGIVFLQGSTSPHRQKVLEGLPKLRESPAGQQVLELAQTETFTIQSISCLNDSLKLLNRHRQLSGNE